MGFMQVEIGNVAASDLCDEERLLNLSFKTKSKATALARLVLAAAVWHLWKERNLRIFNQKSLTKIQRFNQLTQDISVLIQNCKWEDDQDVTKASLLQNWIISVSD